MQPLLFSRFKLRSWAASAPTISATPAFIFRFVILYNTRWPIESQHLDFVPFNPFFNNLSNVSYARVILIETFERKGYKEYKKIIKERKIGSK